MKFKTTNTTKLKADSLQQPMINLVKNKRENPQINSIWSERWCIIMDVDIKKMEKDILNNCMTIYYNEMNRSQKNTTVTQKEIEML